MGVALTIIVVTVIAIIITVLVTLRYLYDFRTGPGHPWCPAGTRSRPSQDHTHAVHAGT